MPRVPAFARLRDENLMHKEHGLALDHTAAQRRPYCFLLQHFKYCVINWNATAIFLFVSLSPLRICNTHWSWIGHGKVSVDATRPKFSSLFSCKFSLEKLSGVSVRWWQPKLSSYDVFRGSYTTQVVRWQHPFWGSFQFTLPPLFCSALGGMNDEKFLRQQLYVFEERVRELESATNNEDCAQVHTEQNSSGVFFPTSSCS